MFPIINIFNRSIGSYALLSFLGFIVCGFAITLSSKRMKIAIEDSVILILVTAIGLLLGGHLLYGLTNISELLNLIFNISNFSFKEILERLSKIFGGMVFYGGFIGGLLALKIYKNSIKSPYRSYIFDIYAFSIPLFHFFGRIGCFLAGCCYGIECKIGFIVKNNPLVPDINNVRRFPISILEAFLNLLIFIIIFNFYKKKKFESKLIYCYMLLYPTIRFFTEFLRGDSVRGFFFSLSTSQWISLFLLLYAILKLIYLRKTDRIQTQ